MPSQDSERRLAAILHADVVGYSRLMAEDETAAVRSLSDTNPAQRGTASRPQVDW